MQQHGAHWRNRGQFFARSRHRRCGASSWTTPARKAAKRGDGDEVLNVDDLAASVHPSPDEEPLALDAALSSWRRSMRVSRGW